MVDRFDYEHTMQESLGLYPDGQFVLYSDYAPLAAEVEQIRKERAINDPSEIHAANVQADLTESRAEKAGAEVERLKDLIRWAHDTLYEINLSNYDHDEVCKLNGASVEVILGLAPTLGERHGKSKDWWLARAKAEEGNAIGAVGGAARAEASAAVKVKALEWERGWMNAEAQTEIGRYEIAYRRDGSFEWSIGILKGWASSWDAAKAAAQADYERRILSTLTTKPAAPQEAGPVAYVDLRVLGSLSMGTTAIDCTLYAEPHESSLSTAALYLDHPPAQAVTEAMVEAALAEWFKGEVTWSAGMAPSTKDQMISDMRAALTAAQEARHAD